MEYGEATAEPVASILHLNHVQNNVTHLPTTFFHHHVLTVLLCRGHKWTLDHQHSRKWSETYTWQPVNNNTKKNMMRNNGWRIQAKERSSLLAVGGLKDGSFSIFVQPLHVPLCLNAAKQTQSMWSTNTRTGSVFVSSTGHNVKVTRSRSTGQEVNSKTSLSLKWNFLKYSVLTLKKRIFIKLV